MNKLEQLSRNDKRNYNRYLKRMTESVKVSTKGFIPMMARNSKKILDVGCGSGVLMYAIANENPTAEITGLDLNADAINKLKEQNAPFELVQGDFMEHNGKYDAVIFSSILHEISSYYLDEALRFSIMPINDAIKKAYTLLEKGGSLIIRDGILTVSNTPIIISFKDVKDSEWLFKFQKDFRGFNKRAELIDKTIKWVEDGKWIIGETFLKEFLCKYTWGPSSYPREIQELFGILTEEAWIEILEHNGFQIETVTKSKEDYEKYLKDKITLTYKDGTPYDYPYMSIILQAKKK